jgi:hypothetical protein
LKFLSSTGPDFDAPPPWKKGFEIPILFDGGNSGDCDRIHARAE